MKLLGLSVVVLAMVVTGAQGAVIEDFEGYEIGAAFQGGTIVADPDNAGNKVLSLQYGTAATSALIAIPDAPLAGVVSMDIYDYGKAPGAHYGPRWGVLATEYYAAAYLRQGAGVNSTAGYAMTWDSQPTSAWAWNASSWFSAKFFGGPRLVDALQDDANGVVADGAWSTWTFTSSGGACYINNGTVLNSTGYKVGLMTDVFLWSGRDVGLAGVLVDNIAFAVPEPATLGLLGFGALGLVVRRRDRKA